jgi:hypothetical protein
VRIQTCLSPKMLTVSIFGAASFCRFTNERTTFATFNSRCDGEGCAWKWIDYDESEEHCLQYGGKAPLIKFCLEIY